MNNYFINFIKIKNLINLVINYIDCDTYSLYNISKIIRLYNNSIIKIIDKKIFNYNIKNVNRELLLNILEEDDLGSIILYRIQGMPLLEDIN